MQNWPSIPHFPLSLELRAPLSHCGSVSLPTPARPHGYWPRWAEQWRAPLADTSCQAGVTVEPRCPRGSLIPVFSMFWRLLSQEGHHCWASIGLLAPPSGHWNCRRHTGQDTSGHLLGFSLPSRLLSRKLEALACCLCDLLQGHPSSVALCFLSVKCTV